MRIELQEKDKDGLVNIVGKVTQQEADLFFGVGFATIIQMGVAYFNQLNDGVGEAEDDEDNQLDFDFGDTPVQ